MQPKSPRSERHRHILEIICQSGFASFASLETSIPAAPATLERDLARLASIGLVVRVGGGVRIGPNFVGRWNSLSPMPVARTIPSRATTLARKRLIGKRAAALCGAGDTVVIDGGSTTLEMCPYLAGLGLSVLTNSLQIAGALFSQDRTRIHFVSGRVTRQGVIVPASAREANIPRIHAPRLFMGAGAICRKGIRQQDLYRHTGAVPLVERAQEIIVLADSSKFSPSHGAVLCALEDVDILVTDDGIDDDIAEAIEGSGIQLLIAASR